MKSLWIWILKTIIFFIAEHGRLWVYFIHFVFFIIKFICWMNWMNLYLNLFGGVGLISMALEHWNYEFGHFFFQYFRFWILLSKTKKSIMYIFIPFSGKWHSICLFEVPCKRIIVVSRLGNVNLVNYRLVFNLIFRHFFFLLEFLKLKSQFLVQIENLYSVPFHISHNFTNHKI